MEQVQALADISRSPLCCHCNETRTSNCKSGQQCTTRGAHLPFPQVTSGSMQ